MIVGSFFASPLRRCRFINAPLFEFQAGPPAGEDMPETQRVCEVQQRHPMFPCWPYLGPPTPYGERIRHETAGHLRLGQPGLLLNTRKFLRTRPVAGQPALAVVSTVLLWPRSSSKLVTSDWLTAATRTVYSAPVVSPVIVYDRSSRVVTMACRLVS